MLEPPGVLALAEHLETAHVLQLLPGSDRAVEIGDAARDVGVLGQEGLACGLGLLQTGDLAAGPPGAGLPARRGRSLSAQRRRSGCLRPSVPAVPCDLPTGRGLPSRSPAVPAGRRRPLPGPATGLRLRECLSVLSLILAFAVKSKALAQNPAAGHEVRVRRRKVREGDGSSPWRRCTSSSPTSEIPTSRRSGYSSSRGCARPSCAGSGCGTLTSCATPSASCQL